MPRTHGGLFEQIACFDNLHMAYNEARMGRRASRDVADFSLQAEERLIEIHNHLMWRSWEPGRPREFMVRDPKWRLIQAPPFADRIVHHAMVGVVEPLFERKFIHDSYACRRGKGTLAAVWRVQHFLRVARRNWGDGVYVIHADIKSFFASIRHDVLMAEIRRTIRDPGVLWLWSKVLAAHGDDGVGLPVGALTSQLGANVLLNRLDHVAKDDMGLRHYVRYMDDFVVICRDKDEARAALDRLGDEVAALGLRLNPKTAIFPWRRGADFCGYRIWPTHLLPRKRNIKRWRAKLKAMAWAYRCGTMRIVEIEPRVKSMLAYCKHGSAACTTASVLSDFVLSMSARKQPSHGSI